MQHGMRGRIEATLTNGTLVLEAQILWRHKGTGSPLAVTPGAHTGCSATAGWTGSPGAMDSLGCFQGLWEVHENLKCRLREGTLDVQVNTMVVTTNPELDAEPQLPPPTSLPLDVHVHSFMLRAQHR